MKISTFITLILIISAVFFVMGSMTSEINEYSPEVQINDSAWAGRYDYTEDINASIAPIKNSFDTIQDENKGWFSKLTSGIAAIPAAVIAIPKLIFGSLIMGGSLIVGTFTTVGIPFALILTITVMILVWAIFKLIEIYNRWQT